MAQGGNVHVGVRHLLVSLGVAATMAGGFGLARALPPAGQPRGPDNANANDPPAQQSSAVGDVVLSLLDEPAFAAQHPGQTWLSCAQIHRAPTRKAPSGAAWVALTGDADLPDCWDRYPRVYGASGPVGSTLEDSVGPHTHAVSGREEDAAGGLGFQGHGFDSNSYGGNPPTKAFSTSRSGEGIGPETRPKTFIVQAYIRVN